MSQYLNIINSWSSNAQQGRDRARHAIETQQKTFELQMKNQLLEQQNQATAEATMAAIDSQAQFLVQNAIPKHKIDMQNIVLDAENKVKNQLNFYGGDFNKFMKAGGAQSIAEYRDSVLNSDMAQVIQANQGEVAKYLKDVQENPHLVSDRDRINFQKYMEGEMGAFVFAGSYLDTPAPSNEEIEAASSIEEAYLAKNYDAYLANYMTDMGMTDLEKDKSEYADELLYYVSGQMGTKEHYEWDRALNEAKVKANRKSYSNQLQTIFSNTSGYGALTLQEGLHLEEGVGFWVLEGNEQSMVDLETGFGLKANTDNRKGLNDKKIYGNDIMTDHWNDIAFAVFGDKGSDWNGQLDFDEVQTMQNSREVTVYNENGNRLGGGQHEGNDPFSDDDWRYDGTQLMFKVDTGSKDEHGRPKYKLISRKNIESTSYANKQKIPIMAMVLRDPDKDIYLTGDDDFRYVELHLDNDQLAYKLDKRIGDSAFVPRRTSRGETQSINYQWEEGRPFQYTAENVNNAVGGLYGDVDKLLTKKNFSDKTDSTARSMIMATVFSDVMDTDPRVRLNQIASDKQYDELINKLDKKDYSGYFAILRDSMGLTDDEIFDIRERANIFMSGHSYYHNSMQKQGN